MSDDMRRQAWPSVLQAIAAAAIPLVIAVVGHRYAEALKEREVEARFVELALTILQAPPDTSTVNLRKWALRVVNAYSAVPLDSSVQSDLRDSQSLPVAHSYFSQPEVASTGLRQGDSVFVRVRLPARSTLRWARVQVPDRRYTVQRPLGPGLDSFPILPGGTLFLTILPTGSTDSTVRKVDCSRGCTVDIP